jgi:type VI secretion system secreted protein Hcp
MAAYIKFDGIDGECIKKNHEKWSELENFSQAVHKIGQGATGVARRRGNPELDDIQCMKLMDKSSPKLAEAVLNGKVFPKVEISLTTSTTDSSEEVFYKYELKNVMVSSYSVSGGAQNVPSEHFSLNFEEIKVTYTEMNKEGSKVGNVAYGWKVPEGQKA